jgi:ribonucleotide reductase alpha subunit
VLMAQFPSRRNRRTFLRVPHAGPRLRQYRRAPDVLRHPLRFEGRPGHRRRLTALMTGVSYATSAEMAAELGPFPGFAKNREDMLRVIRNHRRAAYGEAHGYDGLGIAPVPLDAESHRPDQKLVASCQARLGQGVALGEIHGYRNAQASVIAPTGTIGLIMDCDTTGIEPDFALVKFKKLAGGGYFKIINRAVPEALRVLGYESRDRRDRGLCRRPRHARRRPGHQSTRG